MRVAIHGMGRIGRALARQILQSADNAFELVAVNDLAAARQIVHLLQFDSVHGRFEKAMTLHEDGESQWIKCASHTIRCLSEKDVQNLPWRDLAIDLVFDCTGVCHSAHDASPHLTAGAKRVLLSYPTYHATDPTIIYGFNHDTIPPEAPIVSAASCTSNCVVPVLDVLHREFGVQSAHSTTIHAAMNDQSVTDSYANNLRQARAASASLIPVDTALARGVIRFFPHLQGKYAAAAVRIPTLNVSAIDLKVFVSREVTQARLFEVLTKACQTQYRTIMHMTEQPLVSVDFLQDTHSVIVDTTQTQIFDAGRQLRLLLWFDNEWAYACRMLDIAKYWRTITTIMEQPHD